MTIDRRNALKKLAIGGVTAATASAVISSPVFADDAPIPPASPGISASVDGADNLRLNVTLSPGNATCNGSTSGVASVLGSAITLAATPDTVAITGDGESATFTKPDSGAATAQINYFVNYQCTYAAGSVRLRTLRTIRFATSGTGNDWSTSASVDPPTIYDQVYGCTPSSWSSVCP